MKLTKTIIVRIPATMSASFLSALAFSPRDLAHNLHNLFLIYFLAEYACPPKNAATIAATETK